MRVWSRIWSTLRNLFRKQKIEAQLEEEVRSYVEMLTAEKMATGMEESEARRVALAAVGGSEQVKQSVRDARSGTRAETVWQDLRYGFRQLVHNPGFTVTVVLTLALSIGANTAIFSVVNALMLKRLPYQQPERIGTIYTRIVGGVSTEERHHVDGEQWELLRDQVPALLSAVSGVRPAGVNLESGSSAKYVFNGRVSAQYLDVLSIRPVLGRNFTEIEDRPNGPKTVLLSYSLWRNTFAANPNILGQPILLKGEPYVVIGVLPEGATLPLTADLYTALRPTRNGEGGGTNFELITRLREGHTWQEADAEINRAWLHRSNLYELAETPNAQLSYYTVPLQRGQLGTLQPQVLAAMFAAGLILLIACANLAGLMLVRVLRRTPEIATRMALGASQWRIQRQLWMENLLLALIGGVCSIAVGYAVLRGILLLLPERFLPVQQVSLDPRVLGFTLFLSILTSVIFGMLPALVTQHFDLRSCLTTRSGHGREGLRLRQLLISSEVALTVVLLAASGLLIRSLVYLETSRPGFNPHGVMTAKASLDNVRYHDPAKFLALLSESTAAMQQIPGVEQAAIGLSVPYERSLIMGGAKIVDGKEAGEQAVAGEAYVTPGYFGALGIPLLNGRFFTDADRSDTQHVAIVNRSFARKFLHGDNPVGRHLFDDTLIVGMVEDVSMAPGIDPIAPLTTEQMIYVPATQVAKSLIAMAHVWFQPSWIVRTSAPIEGLTAQMQRALAKADPDLPFAGFYSMQDLMNKTLALQRVEVALLSGMAVLALLLSAVGISALIGNIVAQKTKEIGIRMALGASIRRTLLHIGSPGIGAVGLGLLAGLLFSAGALRTMRTVLYGVGFYDFRTILGVVLILLFVALVATLLPALRVVRIDPVRVLREE